jgi:hypothetical protein
MAGGYPPRLRAYRAQQRSNCRRSLFPTSRIDATLRVLPGEPAASEDGAAARRGETLVSRTAAG